MTTRVGGQNVSRETLAELKAFVALVEKWTTRINLVSKASAEHIWDRHLVDSAQLYGLAPPDYQKWVDIGSGGGFPSIIMAILAKEQHPGACFTLIESDHRKSTFLRTVVRELSLPVTVMTERIELAKPQLADVVSARAVSPLSALLPLINRHLRSSGVALLHKGRQFEEEITDASQSWRFDLEVHPSMTDPDARLLRVKRIHRDPK